jgi:CDP-glycerol glycerophosphotransferase (TagB/SpsB family)
VLIAPGLHDTRSVLSTVFAGLASDPRLELLVKAHPKVSTEAVMEMVRAMSGPDGAKGEGAAIEVVREGDIYAWMERSDIFVATYSSAGVEAIAFGLPVVLLVPSATPDMSLFKGHAAPVLAAHGPGDLRQRVDGLLQDPEAAGEYVSSLREVLTDSFGEADGSASSRLATVCAEMAEVARHASAS